MKAYLSSKATLGHRTIFHLLFPTQAEEEAEAEARLILAETEPAQGSFANVSLLTFKRAVRARWHPETQMASALRDALSNFINLEVS